MSECFNCCNRMTPTALVWAGRTQTVLILATGYAIIAAVERELWRNLGSIIPHLGYLSRMSSEYFLGDELDVCPFRKAPVCLHNIFPNTYFMCSYNAVIFLCFVTVDQLAVPCVSKLLYLIYFIQRESIAGSPKLLSIKNYVIEIMTWKFIHTYRERCKTGPTHSRCWNLSPFTSKHTLMRFSKFWNTFPKMSTLTAWIS